MATLLLKNVPDELHKLLKERAERNRRSMNQEALVILEQAMPGRRGLDVKKILALKPIKLERPIDWTAELRRSRDEQDEKDRRLVGKGYRGFPEVEAPIARDGTKTARRKKR